MWICWSSIVIIVMNSVVSYQGQNSGKGKQSDISPRRNDDDEDDGDGYIELNPLISLALVLVKRFVYYISFLLVSRSVCACADIATLPLQTSTACYILSIAHEHRTTFPNSIPRSNRRYGVLNLASENHYQRRRMGYLVVQRPERRKGC